MQPSHQLDLGLKPNYILVHYVCDIHGLVGSLVPIPIPSFSMLHAEKREGLVILTSPNRPDLPAFLHATLKSWE